MSDCLFTKETIKKSAVYTRLKSLLLAAGWTNISSNPVTDFDVFYSTGETGDKELVFQIREDHSGRYFGSTTSQFLQVRSLYSYIPGADGVAGTSPRSENAWSILYCFNGAIGPDADIDLYYHVNKNRIIFAMIPQVCTGLFGSLNFIGLSNESLVNEIKSDGLLFASTHGDFSNSPLITSRPKERTAAPYGIGTIKIDQRREICADGRRLMYKIGYGDTYEGFRGIIDGVYAIKNDAEDIGYLYLSHGDVLIGPDGTSKYLVLAFKDGRYNCWGYMGNTASGYYSLLAIRVE